MSDETEMKSPKTSKTKMVAERKIKIEILRDTANPNTDPKNPEVWPAGKVIEVDVKTAKELLNRKYSGLYEFSGERTSIEKTGFIRVARRYVEPLPEVEDDDLGVA